MWWLCLLNFVMVVLVRETRGSCRESFMTFCDDFADLETIQASLPIITEITIGSEISDPSQMISVNHSNFFLHRLPKLKGITILGRISDIKSFTFYISPTVLRLDYFKFYGNSIKRLRYNAFDSMKITRFKFIKNNLEYIQKGAFYNCDFESVDFSHNQLEQIEPGTLSDGSFRVNKTKQMILRHNNINVIGGPDYCFPSSLKILNLDYNKLGQLGHKIFDNLPDLIELTLSHNEISTLPNLQNLTKLELLDVSYNKILWIRFEIFDNLTNLEVLDLSHNRISNGNMFAASNFPSRYLKLQIGLSFNHLNHLVVQNTTFKNHIITLYGNPFNCICWECLEKFMTANDVQRHYCDLKYFGSGNAPYCINYSGNNCSFVGYDNANPDFTKEDLNRFLGLIENGNKDIKCNLAPQLRLHRDYVV